jgi:hypothetical protein
MNQTIKPTTLGFCIIITLPLLGIVGGLCLYFKHPAEYIWLPACPFRVWTGLLCPGCGTLRATHHVLNGQFDTAFRHQPLLISLLPIFALLISKACYEKLRKTSVTLPFELQIYWLILIVVCLFFLLRNISFDSFEYLRPPNY